MSGSEGADGRPDDQGLDWRAPVLAAAAWAGVWAGTAGLPVLAGGAGALALAVGVLGWWRRSWLVVGAGLVLLLAVAIGGARGWAKATGPVGEWAAQGAVVTIEARLGGGHLSDGGRGGPVWIVDAELVRAEGRGVSWTSGATVRLTASGDIVRAWSSVPAGATVAAVVRLGPAEPQEPVSAWARARASPTVVAPPGPVDAAVTRVRAGLRAAVAGLPAGAGGAGAGPRRR